MKVRPQKIELFLLPSMKGWGGFLKKYEIVHPSCEIELNRKPAKRAT
jgi:hypothetical protein